MDILEEIEKIEQIKPDPADPLTGFSLPKTPEEDYSLEEVVMKWQKTSDPKDADQVLKRLRPTIDSALQSFAGGDRRLRARANIIALDALRSFDPARETKASTMAYHHLQRLNRISAQRSNVVHIPESVANDFAAITKASAELADRNGIEPSVEDLADYTGISEKRINNLEFYGGIKSESASRDDEGRDVVGFNMTKDPVYLDYLYRSVGPIDKKIIEFTSGFNGRKLLPGTEIAKRLHITPAAVSQRLNKLTKRLADIRGRL